MTNDDRMGLLREAVVEMGSQAKVARLLCYSSAAVSQILAGQYKGTLDGFLTRVEEVFGKGEVECPVLGKIAYPTCVAERRKPFSSANPHWVMMYQRCRVCLFNNDPKEE